VNKKERERLKRAKPDTELEARSKSKDRKARIEQLWLEITSGHLVLKESDKELAKHPLVVALAELGELQKCELEYLTQFQRNWEWIHARYPRELENLSSASLDAELWPEVKKWAEQRPSKKVYEAKRSRYGAVVGEIERQFGGPEEFDFLLGKFGPPRGYCLDDIFAGNGVNMWRLQELFGIHRNRFPPRLRNSKKGRERLYDYRAVVKIMDALLAEKPLERKGPARGRPSRLWLSDRDLRTRVLSGIKARINSLAVSERIRAAFLAVVRRHLSNSAKK